MIIAIFMKIIAVFLAIISATLPNWRIPETIIAPVEQVTDWLTILNGYFPVSDILFCITMAIAFELTLFMFRITLGVVSIIRGGGNIDV